MPKPVKKLPVIQLSDDYINNDRFGIEFASSPKKDLITPSTPEYPITPSTPEYPTTPKQNVFNVNSNEYIDAYNTFKKGQDENNGKILPDRSKMEFQLDDKTLPIKPGTTTELENYPGITMERNVPGEGEVTFSNIKRNSKGGLGRIVDNNTNNPNVNRDSLSRETRELYDLRDTIDTKIVPLPTNTNDADVNNKNALTNAMIQEQQNNERLRYANAQAFQSSPARQPITFNNEQAKQQYEANLANVALLDRQKTATSTPTTNNKQTESELDKLKAVELQQKIDAQIMQTITESAKAHPEVVIDLFSNLKQLMPIVQAQEITTSFGRSMGENADLDMTRRKAAEIIKKYMPPPPVKITEQAKAAPQVATLPPDNRSMDEYLYDVARDARSGLYNAGKYVVDAAAENPITTSLGGAGVGALYGLRTGSPWGALAGGLIGGFTGLGYSDASKAIKNPPNISEYLPTIPLFTWKRK